ncbi:MAG: hypothetical protein KGJ77_08655 [Acidobacteriota bacterium]|nr:hypothetical protein [Acidobacteriota bacterium]
MSIVHGPGHHTSGAGAVLRIVTLVLAGLAVAGAVVVVVLPLPKPAAGGTCGPGAGSEPAIAAFFDPVSIGAGPQPATSAIEAYQWQAFVGECQSAANGRMVEGLALLIVAGFFALVVHPLIRRAWHEPAPPGAPGTAAWPGGQTEFWQWPPPAPEPPHASPLSPPSPPEQDATPAPPSPSGPPPVPAEPSTPAETPPDRP